MSHEDTNPDIIKAIDIFNSGRYTCVLCKGDEIFTRTERGVRPLLDFRDNDIDLRGFSAADKVAGKAAAFLYILLGIREVYAHVMSKSAICAFAKYGIPARYDISVENIRNREGDGCCPMEETVKDISDPKEAVKAIKAKLSTSRK